MNLIYIIAGAIVLALLAYLFIALLNPEKFG
jgi:K+-transporting ATPase KdpF subunit